MDFLAVLKLIWKLWPTLKLMVREGAAISEDIQVKRNNNKIEIVFEDQSNEENTDEQTASNASDLNDVFR